jgi:hypothetical protein
MKLNLKKSFAISVVLVCLLAAAGFSKPGRATINKLASVFSPQPPPSPDVEQRARERHGWKDKNIQNSIVRGTVSYFDRSGTEVRRMAITLYRKYPDHLRIEVERDGIMTVSGFDGKDAWRDGVSTITEVEARQIREMLRIWPERLFHARDGGAQYKEKGRHVEDYRPAVPGREPVVFERPMVLQQIEVDDTIGSNERAQGKGRDRRRVSYMISEENSAVYLARWMEPVDPGQEIDDNGPQMDVRVDFSRWREMEGILCPMEITHWRGGKVDYRIDVSEVLFDQQMPATLFQDPNK